MRKIVFLSALLVCVTAVSPCFGDGMLSYTLSPATFTVEDGDTIILPGTLANTGDGDLFLNDFSFQFPSPGDMYLSADPNYFFDNVPGYFAPGDTYMGGIFELYVSDDAPVGTFSAAGTIYGGTDVFADAPIGLQTVTINVVPEPVPAFLLIGGLASIWAARRRFVKATAG